MLCLWNVILLIGCHARHWDLCHVGEMPYCCCAVMQSAEIYFVLVKCHTVVVLSCKALRSMSCGWNVTLLLCCHARRWDLCRVGEMSYCCCAVMQGAEIYVMWVKCHTVVVLSCKALRSMSCGWNVILLLCCHSGLLSWCYVVLIPYIHFAQLCIVYSVLPPVRISSPLLQTAAWTDSTSITHPPPPPRLPYLAVMTRPIMAMVYN